jgi:CzcA family heavy metal efflux pump
LTAIPLSLLGAIVILRSFGISLNAITLGGLAIALGEVVDDAIVDVENVLRRLLQNRSAEAPRPAYQVVLDASLEVRSAVVYASFIVMLVFLPVFFLGGLPGTFFRPLGYAYIAAILVSLLVALTVTPAMCLLLLRNVQPARKQPLMVRIVKQAYSWLLPVVLKRSRQTVAVAAGLLIAAIAWIPFFGGELLPDFRESNVIIFTTLKPDSSLAESTRTGQRMAAQLAKIPGVKSVAQQIGRADLSEDTWGPNISEIAVVLDPDADYDQVLNQLRELTLTGAHLQVKQFLRERIDEVLSGSTADIVIRIVGDDLDVLRNIAGDVVSAIKGIEGLADLRPEQQVDVPQIDVLLKPQSLANYGFSVGDVNHTIQTLVRGTVVGQIYEQEMIHEVVVRAHPDIRDYPAALGRLLIDSPAQEKVPLSALSSISITEAPNIVSHESTHRRMLVTCNAVGRDVASVMQDIQKRLAEQVKLPASGYRLEFGGEYEARNEAQSRLLWFGAASLLGIFVLLYLDFKTLRLTLMVMTSVPLACVGGVAAVALAGGNVSMGSLVGFVTVFGIAVRNGILLVSHYRHLERDESMPFGTELIMRGAMERLVPILMTAGTAALGLLPLVVFGELPGNEIEHPMAVVILGGLVSSTALTLFVLPVLYQRLAKSG